MIWLYLVLVLALLLVALIMLDWRNKTTLPDDSWKDSLARTKGELPHGYPYKKKGD
jgi:hypothetical protein